MIAVATFLILIIADLIGLAIKDGFLFAFAEIRQIWASDSNCVNCKTFFGYDVQVIQIYLSLIGFQTQKLITIPSDKANAILIW